MSATYKLLINFRSVILEERKVSDQNIKSFLWMPVNSGCIAEFEREILLERQRIGIAKAKTESRYNGRKPIARDKELAIQRITAEGMKPKSISEALGISVPSVNKYRKG